MRASAARSAVLRAVPGEDAAQSESHGCRRARRLQDREGDLREPTGVPRVGEPVYPQGTALAAPAWSVRAGTRTTARRATRIRRFARGSPPGLRRADLRSDRQGERLQYVDANWKPRRGIGTASTTTRATSSSWSTSSSARGAPGTASAPSTTWSRAKRSTPSTSASPATRVAAR